MGVYRDVLDRMGVTPPGVEVHPRSVWVATAASNPFPLAAVGVKALLAPPGREFQVLGDELVNALPYTTRQLPGQVREAATGYTHRAVGNQLSM